MRTKNKTGAEVPQLDQDFIHEEKIRVAITSIIASASLTISKVIIGLLANSLGILSEGLHSGLDLVAASMTLYAVRMVRKPPDLEHNYGYGKIESITSLGEIILLLLVAAWIMYEGIERLLFTHAQPEITVYAFGVMIASIIVDYGRSKALFRVARKYGSQALEADALHFRVDMLTSGIVLGGLTVVYLFNIPNADVFAAISVSLLIVYTTLGLGRRTLDVLLDKAPKGVQAQIVESLTGFEDIKNIHNIRVRKVGKNVFVDLHIELPRLLTNDKAHSIATNVENKIKTGILPNADIVVHVDAVEDENTETLKDKIRLIASEFSEIENIHSIYISKIRKNKVNRPNDGGVIDIRSPDRQDDNDQLHISLDMQVKGSQNLRAMHAIVDQFENRIKGNIPGIKQITTHIESEVDSERIIGSEQTIDHSFVENIRKIAISIKGVVDCKDISIAYIGNDMHIAFTIKLDTELSQYTHDQSQELRKVSDYTENVKDAGMTIDEAHNIATKVQNLVIKNTGASRVVIHTEPM